MTTPIAKTARRVTRALCVLSKIPVQKQSREPPVQGEKIDPRDWDIIYPSRETPAEYLDLSRPSHSRTKKVGRILSKFGSLLAKLPINSE